MKDWCKQKVESKITRLKIIHVYALELQEIVTEHCTISFHGFADDTQVGKTMVVSDIQAGDQYCLHRAGAAIVDWS